MGIRTEQYILYSLLYMYDAEKLTLYYCYLADALIQSDLQLIRLSRGLMEQCGFKGLAQGPNSCTDLIVATVGFEPPTFWVPVKPLSHRVRTESNRVKPQESSRSNSENHKEGVETEPQEHGVFRIPAFPAFRGNTRRRRPIAMRRSACSRSEPCGLRGRKARGRGETGGELIDFAVSSFPSPRQAQTPRHQPGHSGCPRSLTAVQPSLRH